MAVGLRAGLAVGLRVGLAPGVSSDEIVGSGTGDGPSGNIQVPMTALAFSTLTGRSPTHAYPCQETSGNLADSIGSLTLTAAGTPLYQVSVTGWIRKGVGFNEGAGQKFSVGAGSGPNPTSTPVAMLAYVTMRTPAASRTISMIADAGAGTRAITQVTTGGLLSTICGATTNNGVVDHRDSAVHPLLLCYDAAGTTINRYSDLEKDNGTFAAGVTDGTKGIGAIGGGNSWLGECLALWTLEGTDAQFTDAQAKSMLVALGWSPPWS